MFLSSCSCPFYGRGRVGERQLSCILSLKAGRLENGKVSRKADSRAKGLRVKANELPRGMNRPGNEPSASSGGGL